jgi:hypothetical protein
MPTEAAEAKLDEVDALQIFVDAFIATKDIERAWEAVEFKLRCQREYVIWRDAVVPIGRPLKDCSTEIVLPPNDPGHLTAHRWRKDLKDPAAFHKTVAKSKIKVVSLLERGSIRKKDVAEFYTPAPIIKLAREVLGEIDLDPASCLEAQQTVQATSFFCKKDDAITQEWHGRVWLNPPFGREIVPRFVEKLLTEIENSHVKAAILLVNNCTETKWFANAARSAKAICFHTGRITFDTLAEPHEVTQGQALFYWGGALEQFIKEFSTIGWVALPHTSPFASLRIEA